MLKFLLILLLSCGNVSQKSFAKQRSLTGPFYNENGDCLNNIGHRVGGDFSGLKDNNLESAFKIKHLEQHKCFRRWEFDVTSSKESVIVFHDRKINGKPTRFIPSYKIKAHKLTHLIEGLLKLSPRKPLQFDIKDIRERDFDHVLNQAVKSSKHVGVFFSMSKRREYHYKDFIEQANALGFKVYFYE